jgi:EAL domain-containing protein (putative c-di-GMP-specific phosphodiesterase class I)
VRVEYAPTIETRDVAHAIARNELSLVYQPKIRLPFGHLIGVESLARWRHPEQGWVSPSVFVRVAEQTELIGNLTEHLLCASLSQWRKWRDAGLTTDLAINISAKNLRNVDFPNVFERLCQGQGVSCQHLTVELTESATQEVVQLMDTLTRFRLKGVRLSLDDFGIGYSSLAQLQKLPFTELKIDKSFVMQAERSRDCRTIIKSSIDLAHNLGIEATAEGVETKGALALLIDLGCDNAQGYFIAKPMPGDVFSKWSAGWESWINSSRLEPVLGREAIKPCG